MYEKVDRVRRGEKDEDVLLHRGGKGGDEGAYFHNIFVNADFFLGNRENTGKNTGIIQHTVDLLVYL